MLGAPTSDEIRDPTSFPQDWGVEDFEVMQTFEYGSMFWDAETGLVRMFSDYGTCELNREGEVIALCTPENQSAQRPDRVAPSDEQCRSLQPRR